MIWRWSAPSHTTSIGGFARRWLGGTLFDRWLAVTIVGWLWFMIWTGIGASTKDTTGFLMCAAIATAPWWVWLLDGWLDSRSVQQDCARFIADGAILATRCEYLGGHPQLPHGRFAYLLLEGTKQNPALNLVFPQSPGTRAERFPLPLLDLKKTKPEKGSDASPFADIAAVIQKDAGRLFRPERLVLVVDYDGYAGRTHKVELTNFFHGNNEIRNWRNYMVCAQAESDTGVTPHQPWASLKSEPEVAGQKAQGELANAFSRNGHEEQQPSSAFARR